MNKVLFDNVSKSDANALVSWWNANTEHYHFMERLCTRGEERFKIVRQ